jgi:hypothetical protein
MQNKNVVESISRRLGFQNCLPVSVKGKGGGLALFGNDNVISDIIESGPHFIDVMILESSEIKWRATFVYGEPRTEDRYLMWELLHRIKQSAVDP